MSSLDFETEHDVNEWLGAPPNHYPLNTVQPAAVASLVVATGPVRLFGFLGYNSNAAAQFVLVFDADRLPADGAVPLFALKAGGASNFSSFYGSVGRWFNRGIVLCNSSTFATKTIGAADCTFDVQYGF